MLLSRVSTEWADKAEN